MTSGLTCGFALGIFSRFFYMIQETDFTNIVFAAAMVCWWRAFALFELILIIYFLFC